MIEAASEQPASGSGISTVLSGERIAAVSAMKWTPQKTIAAAVRGRGLAGQAERVADVVGHVLHLGHLVVVGEDDRVALARQGLAPRPAATVDLERRSQNLQGDVEGRARNGSARRRRSKSTPVSAIARTVSSVTPPEASSSARPATSATAARDLVGRHVVEQDRGRRPPRAPRRPASSVSDSTSTAGGRSRGLGERPRRSPPASRRWLSLISTPSSRPRRWFVPPPQRTAYFSRPRRPGRRLAGVEDRRAGAVDGVDVAAGERGDARQAAEQVEREPLARQHRARRALDPRDRPRHVDRGRRRRRAARAEPRRAPRTRSAAAQAADDARLLDQTLRRQRSSGERAPGRRRRRADVLGQRAPRSLGGRRAAISCRVSSIAPAARARRRAENGVRGERLVLEREVGAEVAAAALARGAARPPRPDAASAEALAQLSSPAASRISPASATSARAALASTSSTSADDVAPGSHGDAERRVGERRERGAAAEDEALEQRVRRQTVRAVDARAGALARRVQPGTPVRPSRSVTMPPIV